MELRSSSLRHGKLPPKYSRDLDNVAPSLEWSDPPANARAFAVLFETISPQTQPPHVQWLIYDIPGDVDHLPEGIMHKRDPDEPAPAVHGTNDSGNIGYDGPVGVADRTIRMRFTLFALDRGLGAGPGLRRDEFMEKIRGHVVDQAELICEYERPRQEAIRR